MPLVGIILGGIDFAALSIQVGSATVLYGKFIQAIVNFLIIAFVIFLVMRAMVKLKKQEAAAPPPGPTAEEKLLTEIRDLLKAASRDSPHKNPHTERDNNRRTGKPVRRLRFKLSVHSDQPIRC